MTMLPIFIALLLVVPARVLAQNYWPLEDGNYWEYIGEPYVSDSPADTGNDSGTVRLQVFSDSTLEGYRVFGLIAQMTTRDTTIVDSSYKYYMLRENEIYSSYYRNDFQSYTLFLATDLASRDFWVNSYGDTTYVLYYGTCHTPAGIFSDCRATVANDGADTTVFAPGVGNVREDGLILVDYGVQSGSTLPSMLRRPPDTRKGVGLTLTATGRRVPSQLLRFTSGLLFEISPNHVHRSVRVSAFKQETR